VSCALQTQNGAFSIRPTRIIRSFILYAIYLVIPWLINNALAEHGGQGWNKDTNLPTGKVRLPDEQIFQGSFEGTGADTPFNPGSGPVTNSFKLMTFNTARNSNEDQFTVIAIHDPDIVGFQELPTNAQDAYQTEYADGKYTFFGTAVIRDAGPIMVNTDRFEVLDSDMNNEINVDHIEAGNLGFQCGSVTKTLADGSPDDTPINFPHRFIDWVHIEDRNSGERYMVYNSHFVAPTFEPFAVCQHAYQSMQLLELVEAKKVEYSDNHKAILLCDCNDGASNSESMSMLINAKMLDSFRTFNADYSAWAGTGGGVDRIFGENLQIVDSYHDQSTAGDSASDHRALITEYDACAVAECATAPTVVVSLPPTDPDQITDAHMENVFINSGCLQCHNGSNAFAGLDLSADDWPDNLLDVAPSSGASECIDAGYDRAEAGYPGNSLIYRKIVHREPCGDSMPAEQRSDIFFNLKAGGAGTIHRWIRNQGGFNKTAIINPTVADVNALFTEYACTTCHGSDDGFDPIHLDLQGDIVAALVGVLPEDDGDEDMGHCAGAVDDKGDAMFLVEAGDAEGSILYHKVSRAYRGSVCGDPMPFGATMDEADAETILNWINNM